MLTGGNTAKQLYKHWTDVKPWNHREVRNFFGDESCVTPDHQDSNYCMMKNALFLKSIPKDCTITRMEGELSDREAAAKNYENMFPGSTEILLLFAGSD